MKFSAVLFAGVAAAAAYPSSSAYVAPVPSSKPYVLAPPSSKPYYAPAPSSKGYDYQPAPSVKPAPVSSKKYEAPPKWTTLECEGPTTITYNKKTYTATTKTSWVVECETETPAPETPVYHPTYNATVPVYPSSTKGPLQVTANAAVNNVAGAGAALAGVFGAVAYLL